MKKRTKKNNKLLNLFIQPLKFYLRILLIVVAVGIYQYQSIQIDILARDIRTLELKRDQLINDKTTLQVQINQLTHLSRIEKIAKEKLGLNSQGQEPEQLIIKKYDGPAGDHRDTNSLKLKYAGVQ